MGRKVDVCLRPSILSMSGCLAQEDQCELRNSTGGPLSPHYNTITENIEA